MTDFARNKTLHAHKNEMLCEHSTYSIETQLYYLRVRRFIFATKFVLVSKNNLLLSEHSRAD